MGIQILTLEPEVKDMPLVSALCDEYKINVAIHNHPYPKHYWNTNEEVDDMYKKKVQQNFIEGLRQLDANAKNQYNCFISTSKYYFSLQKLAS